MIANTHKGTKGAIFALLIFLSAMAGVPGYTAADPKAIYSPAVRSVASVGFTVRDADRSIEFFSNVLSFEKISDVEVAGGDYEHFYGVFGLRMRVVDMRLGEEQIRLTEYLAPRGRPVPPDSRSNDLWFQHIAIVTGDIERSYDWLRKHKVAHVSPNPQRLPDWNPNAGGIKAFYFNDPDRHVLEILQFPDDKGDPRWRRLAQEYPDRMFLGIDHTAIVVGDTDKSLKFYRDTLGMRVAGESENYGVEQERLNNVFGARLRITSLRAGKGPGIELLEYMTPRDGRRTPEDQRANDLAQWQTRLEVDDARSFAPRLRTSGVRFVSTDIVDLTLQALGFKRGFMVLDPDAHAIQITN